MALLESIYINPGTLMPEFNLNNPIGKEYSSKSLMGTRGLLIAFTCNHCPYAIAIWPRLIELASNALKSGIQTVAINPNIHPDYPEDAPDKMIEKIAEWHIPFPYLIDEDQIVAREFSAQCTPDLYLYDESFKLVYHGRVDDNWQDPSKVKEKDLKRALRNLSNGLPIEEKQHPSLGCSIKWKD